MAERASRCLSAKTCSVAEAAHQMIGRRDRAATKWGGRRARHPAGEGKRGNRLKENFSTACWVMRSLLELEPDSHMMPLRRELAAISEKK